MLDVVVVGGGISGLAACYGLTCKGYSCVLLEAEAKVGGKIKSLRKGDYLLEYGPNSCLASDKLVEIVNSVGLKDEMIAAGPRAARYVYFQGRLHKVPTNPLALVTTSLLSFRAKLRLLREPFVKRQVGVGDESLRDFVVRRFGLEVYERLFAPFISGIYAGDAAKMSATAAFPKLVALERQYGSVLYGTLRSMRGRGSGSLVSFDSGLERLPQGLATGLGDAVHTNARVQTVKFRATSPRYIVIAGGKEFAADRLVIGLPAYDAAAILTEALPELAALLNEIEYAPLVVVHVSYRLEELGFSPDGFGFLVVRTEGLRLLGAIHSSTLFPRRSPQESVLLTCFLGGATDPDVIELDDAELGEIVASELGRILGTSVRADVLSVWKIPRAIPQYSLGHLDRLRKIDKLLEGKPGLRLVGNYLRGVSVPDCIEKGLEMATSL